MDGRLTRADALDVVRDIETGRGRIAALARKRAWIRRAARELLEEGHGDRLVLWRAVSAVGGLRPDAAVSTSLDPGVAFGIAADFPLLLGGDRTVVPRPVVLRYEVPVALALAHVPSLYRAAAAVLGEGARIRDRHGAPLSVAALAEAVEREREVVADVAGVAPAVLELGAGWFDKLVVADVVEGRFSTGAELVARHNATSGMKLSADSAAAADALAAGVSAFLRGEGPEPAPGPAPAP
jgi:hypothetical protein